MLRLIMMSIIRTVFKYLSAMTLAQTGNTQANGYEQDSSKMQQLYCLIKKNIIAQYTVAIPEN
ncbi:MAG: hypothetical protein ABIJ30_00625 [bacterium]